MITLEKLVKKMIKRLVFLLDYDYFNKYYKMIAIDLSINKHLMLIQKQYNKLILQEI